MNQVLTMEQLAIKVGMTQSVHAMNIRTMLSTMPYSIEQDLLACINAWATGYSAYGYSHPVSVCATYMYRNQYDKNLDAQQYLNMSILKREIAAFFSELNNKEGYHA